MRSFRSLGAMRAAMTAALGLTSIACGGATTGAMPADDAGLPPETPDGGHVGPDAGPMPEEAGPAPLDAEPDVLRFKCETPTAILVQGADTGFDRCANGIVRRRAIIDCPAFAPRPTPDAVCAADAAYGCTSDQACVAARGGKPAACLSGALFGGPPGCECISGCVRDSDCDPGYICQCGDPIGQCVQAKCSPGSCGAGSECADEWSDPGCPQRVFACQAIHDQCFADSDCPPGLYCGIDRTADPPIRTCERTTCAVGRPFLVAGEARLAPAVVRRDWRLAPAAPGVESLAHETRARLAESWTRIARMEHASIAAFARFAMQLLAVGAPPDLVQEAQRAMADETKHARLAFGLASAYAGAEVGPGPLAIDGSLVATDLRVLLATVFAEGCVGETVAALEAREALEHAEDPAVRAVLETIAEDEQRHAALAWKTVAWIVEVAGPKALRWIDEAAEAASLAEGDGPGADPAYDDLLVHGVVGDALRQRLRRAALAQVVLPCACSARGLVELAA